MRDEAYKICPKELCRRAKWGKGKVTRLVGTGAGLIFKGSGFYITDYRSNSYKEAAKKDSSSGSEKSAGDSGAGKPAGQPAAATAQKSEAKTKKESAS